MSLIYGDNFATQISLIGKSNVFFKLFYGCTKLISAETLLMPSVILVDKCYRYMFSGCTSLTTPPKLPAITLANYCYDSMFSGCTSLTAAPALPATTLANYCYDSMFIGCTSLTSSPVLLAKVLKVYCYAYMFSGCKNLNYITMLATNVRTTNALDGWVTNVSSSGTFVKEKGVDLERGVNGIPSGWTVSTL